MENAFHSAPNANDNARRPISKTSAVRWLPYLIAACLMGLAISQARQILDLNAQLLAARTDATRLRESNALAGLLLATLQPKDASYASAQIIVAWDAYQHRGVIATQNLSAPPTGHDYQLWVLDPTALAPVSAGLLTGSRPFLAKPVSAPNSGFAISLEPAGGSPEPTGPILFAVAPGP
jgi:anti-sigma-K factor RskA